MQPTFSIVLATGIYPPDFGGPATYTVKLAKELSERGHRVTVITFSSANPSQGETSNEPIRQAQGRQPVTNNWRVIFVPRGGGPLLRWWRYAQALKAQAAHADIIEAFSSISCGVPLALARLKTPKKILRLGGDFFWERYTDSGGAKGLAEWTAGATVHRKLMSKILSVFDHIVFSTTFQEELYEMNYRFLPSHSVIENAMPTPHGALTAHTVHSPFRILFMGRFVRFKNLSSLIMAIAQMPDVTLTLTGAGPDESLLRKLVGTLNVHDRVQFQAPLHSDESRRNCFDTHDLMIVPSITEISPNVALEARSTGLPVLLTETTGLSLMLTRGMELRPLKTPSDIVKALRELMAKYASVAEAAAHAPPQRSWSDVTDEHVRLFQSLR